MAERPGIGVAEAAKELQLAANTVSTLVIQLSSAGLLARTPDPADRRAAQLTITHAAEIRIAAWRRRRAQLLSVAIETLPPADREALEAAVSVLERLAVSLEAIT